MQISTSTVLKVAVKCFEEKQAETKVFWQQNSGKNFYSVFFIMEAEESNILTLRKAVDNQ